MVDVVGTNPISVDSTKLQISFSFSYKMKIIKQILRLSICVSVFFQPIHGQSQEYGEEYLDQLEDDIVQLSASAQKFPDLITELGLLETGQVTLSKILEPDFKNFLFVDDQLVSQSLGIPVSEAKEQLQETWHGSLFSTEKYQPFPTLIRVSESPGTANPQIQLYTASNWLNSGSSKKLFYSTWLKAYLSLPSELNKNTSAFGYGLAALLAQEFTHKGSLTILPEFEIEAAMAALIAKSNETKVVPMLYGQDSEVDWDNYVQQALRPAFEKIKGNFSQNDLSELLKEPSDYYNITVDETGSTRENDIIPPIHPAMNMLWQLLPNDAGSLINGANGLKRNIINPTYRAILTNAYWDKYAAVVGREKFSTDLLIDSTILLRNLDQADDLLGTFAEAKQELVDTFRNEIEARDNLDSADKIIAYDPSLLAWTFRFLYNYSHAIRVAEAEHRDVSIDEPEAENEPNPQNPIEEEKTDKQFAESLTPDTIKSWWKTDQHIAELFQIVGEPTLKLENPGEGEVGLALRISWEFERHNTSDTEKVNLIIVDPFASPGAKATPKPDPEIKTPKTQPKVTALAEKEREALGEIETGGEEGVGTTGQGQGEEGKGVGKDGFGDGEGGAGGGGPGGGSPIPGVYGEAKVLVKSNLDQPVREISLKDIQVNDYIQTVSKIPIRSANESVEAWVRVVGKKNAGTPGTILLDSNAKQDLEVGLRQAVFIFDNQKNRWGWKLAEELKGSELSLLGVTPKETPQDNNAVSILPSKLEVVERTKTSRDLFQLTLSHQDVDEVKSSGTNQWGYFADGRFVYAQVKIPKPGVEGPALVDLDKTISGSEFKKLSGIETKEPIVGINAGNPMLFQTYFTRKSNQVVQYHIIFQYRFEDGSNQVLNVAEGQMLVDGTNNSISLKRAYQFKKGDQLVSGFDSNKQPILATITGLQGTEAPLSVYQTVMKRCRFYRANGLLIPVNNNSVRSTPGIEDEVLVQLGPSIEIIQKSNIEAINLPNSSQQTAKEILGDATILAINTFVEPHGFWNAKLEGKKTHNNDRYVRIVTPHTTLTAGHKQEIYVARNGRLDDLMAIPAGNITSNHQLVWIDAPLTDSSFRSLTETENDYLSESGKSNQIVEPNSVTQSKVSVVPVISVHDMESTKEQEYFNFHEFKVGDSRISDLGFKPTMFANGILVKIRHAYQTGKTGGGGGSRGLEKKPTELVSETQTEGDLKLSYKGLLKSSRNEYGEILFNEEDFQSFVQSAVQLDKLANLLAKKPGRARKNVLSSFLNNYFSPVPDVNEVYANLPKYYNDYVVSRNWLIQAKDPRILPEVVNSYLFVATLLYESGNHQSGDAITQDFLNLILRILSKPEGTSYYRSSELNIRDALLTIRDVQHFIKAREKKPRPDITMIGEANANYLHENVAKPNGLKEVITDTGDIHIYNLCNQLDVWAQKNSSSLYESLMTTGSKQKGYPLYNNEAYRARLKTR